MGSLTKRHLPTPARPPTLPPRQLEDRPMKALLIALMVAASALAPSSALANEADIRATYKDFAAAQNARDLHKIGALLLDWPRFLWVSDGRSVWGREAT